MSSAPKIEVIKAPPRSRWRSAVPEAMPTRVTGTEPVSELDDGVPDRPTPIPMKMYGIATCQYGVPSFQSRSMVRKARKRIPCPVRSVLREPFECTSFAERGATRTMKMPAGRMAAPASRVE